MNLRKLKQDDAPLMLEWMHSKETVKHLQNNFTDMSIVDCQSFIKASENDVQNLHMAIVDDNNSYVGTVSLKHIDRLKNTAEFAIVIRPCYMGRKFSKYAMTEILKIGIEDLKLNKIYWCVSRENQRAIRFYDKNGYHRTQIEAWEVEDNYTAAQVDSFIWYSIEKGSFIAGSRPC
ncbi:acetyltransferase GNAT family [Enterocloster bolteae CAG:59]|nr:acetyltransferase GNAT family [Enterocloster bolteae CAG:59]